MLLKASAGLPLSLMHKTGQQTCQALRRLVSSGSDLAANSKKILFSLGHVSDLASL